MTHLFLGLDPKYIREEPYIPTVSAPPRASAAELGLRINPHASIYCMPSVGSYVGGDITSGVLSSGLFLTDKLTLFIDVGTNGEIVLGNKDWLISCACSAGPAFEGGGVRNGMRATAGAIEDVWIHRTDLRATFRTISNRPALGHLRQRPHRPAGRDVHHRDHRQVGPHQPDAAHAARAPGRSRAGVRGGLGAGDRAGQDIVLNEADINNLLRAKAAIYAGFSVLCRSVGVSLADVEQILIGGAFGQYINVEKAIQIGLMPDQPWDRFRYLGNTSALGAYTALLCTDMRREVVEIARKMTYLELSADNTFMDEYTSALFLPHTDIETFPSVKALLGKLLTTRGEMAPQNP